MQNSIPWSMRCIGGEQSIQSRSPGFEPEGCKAASYAGMYFDSGLRLPASSHGMLLDRTQRVERIQSQPI